MKRTFFFILLLFLLNPLYLSAQAKSVGKFSKVEGRVDITSPGASARPVNTGDEVAVGDIIRVKSKSKAEIVFGDGGILRIAQKSRVKIDEYIMEEERKKGIFNLFRGKIENVLKKSGGFFGFKEKSKHEVHTPTAVCGVRGTDFFSTYQKGISNFVFKEGQGYGYSKNRPDLVTNINAGQAMLIVNPDVPPIVRMATVNEIARHSADTAIKEEEDRDEEKKGDESVGEVSDDKKRDDKTKDKEPGKDEEKDQEPGDDELRDQGPDDQEPGDEDRGDDRRGDDEPGDDGRGDHRRGDREPGDGTPDRYGPRDDRRGDDGPDDYGPRDHGPDGPPGDYRAGDYGPDGPPRGDYGPDGPPPPGEYWGEGPPPPGEYWGEGPPPPGEYWGEGPPPPDEYWGEGPPPPGEYWGEGPPPPGDYWGEPGDDYWGEPGDDYWGEPGDDYWGEPGDDYWGEPGDDYWGEPGDDYWGEPGDDYWGEPGDDYWGEPGDDYWGEPGDDFWNPDIAFDIDDYLIQPFSVDSITISGNSDSNKYDLSMSGVYNQSPPFVYMYENIRGALSGSLKSGYFYGFTGCGWDPYGQSVNGSAAFFYIASDGSGGIMGGDVSGSYSTDLHDWSASGSLDWVELGNPGTLTVPGSVAGITDYARDIFIVSGTGSGNFYDTGNGDIGDFNIYKSDGIFDSIKEGEGGYWGFWQNHIGSTYSTVSDNTLVDNCDDWFLEWEQKGWEVDTNIQNLRLYMSAKGTIPNYKRVEGDMAGGWVDIEHAVTGIAVGELDGGYNPYENEIFAGGGGVWLNTEDFLTMAGVIGASPNTAGLDKLDIPRFNIGQATLIQVDLSDLQKLTNVKMTDVTFFAYTDGSTNPRIWATNNVSGNYVDSPLGDIATLSGNGLSATVEIKEWNSTPDKWAGAVSGSGTYDNNGADMHNKAITFKGGTAGSIVNGTDFSGTAAGWAKEN